MVMDSTLDENGAELYRLTKLYTAPAFVKSAQRADLAPGGEPPLAVYADPRHRRYPCHTKAATWANYALFLEQRGEYRRADAEAIEERFTQAARLHGIDKTAAALKEAVAKAAQPETDTELPDDLFAVVSPGERHLPMRNSLEVKRAAEYLLTHRDTIPLEIRQPAATRILMKAAEYGVALGILTEPTEKTAGYGAGTAAEASALIRERVAASRKGPGDLSDLQREMLKLAELVDTKPAQFRAPEARVKLASLIDRFDRACGLTGRVRDGLLPRIEDTLFSLTREKMAAARDEHTHTLTGNIYRLEDVERLKLATVRATLGEDVAESLTADGLHVSGEKAAAVIPTLPRGEASLFDRLMLAQGMAPVAKEASAQAVNLERSFLQSIATPPIKSRS